MLGRDCAHDGAVAWMSQPRSCWSLPCQLCEGRRCNKLLRPGQMYALFMLTSANHGALACSPSPPVESLVVQHGHHCSHACVRRGGHCVRRPVQPLQSRASHGLTQTTRVRHPIPRVGTAPHTTLPAASRPLHVRVRCSSCGTTFTTGSVYTLCSTELYYAPLNP